MLAPATSTSRALAFCIINISSCLDQMDIHSILGFFFISAFTLHRTRKYTASPPSLLHIWFYSKLPWITSFKQLIPFLLMLKSLSMLAIRCLLVIYQQMFFLISHMKIQAHILSFLSNHLPLLLYFYLPLLKCLAHNPLLKFIKELKLSVLSI